MTTRQEKIDKALEAYEKVKAPAWEAYRKVQREAKDD